MPFLHVYTNAELKDKNAAEFCERAAELLSDALGKPISYIVVNLRQNSAMSFGGSAAAKGALVYLQSIGFGGRKADVTKLLTEFLSDRLEDLDLPDINIVTTDLAASDVAAGGRFFG